MLLKYLKDNFVCVNTVAPTAQCASTPNFFRYIHSSRCLPETAAPHSDIVLFTVKTV